MPLPQDDETAFKAKEQEMKQAFDKRCQELSELIRLVLAKTNTLMSPRQCQNYLFLKDEIAKFLVKTGLDWSKLYAQKTNELLEKVDFALVLSMLLPRDFDVSQLFKGEHQLDKGQNKDGIQAFDMRDVQTNKKDGLVLLVRHDAAKIPDSRPDYIFYLSVF